jgi:hypothetical protein
MKIISIEIFYLCLIVIFQMTKSISVAFQRTLDFNCSTDSSVLTYGSNWVMDSNGGNNNRIYRGATLVKTTTMSFTINSQYGAFNTNPNTSIYSMIGSNNKITAYANNTFTLIYSSNFTVNKISYLNQNTLTAYSTSAKTVYLTNFTNSTFISKVMPNDSFIDMHSEGGLIALYTKNTVTNLYNLAVLDSNLT